MSAILLSIKPEFVEKIFEGTKKYEFRKRECRKKVDKIVIYATSPVMKIVGEASVKYSINDSPEQVWERTKDDAGITIDFFSQYYDGKSQAVAYYLDNINKYSIPIELSAMGIKAAPQSFIYLD